MLSKLNFITPALFSIILASGASADTTEPLGHISDYGIDAITYHTFTGTQFRNDRTRTHISNDGLTHEAIDYHMARGPAEIKDGCTTSGGTAYALLDLAQIAFQVEIGSEPAESEKNTKPSRRDSATSSSSLTIHRGEHSRTYDLSSFPEFRGQIAERINILFENNDSCRTFSR